MTLTDSNISLAISVAKAVARRSDEFKIDVHFFIEALTELQERRRLARESVMPKRRSDAR